MAYAELCDTPPDLRFGAGAGTWCPMCRGLLAAGPTGWACPACPAEWDYRGLHGRWLNTVADVALPSAGTRPRQAIVDCCARAGAAAVLLGAALVPVEAIAAQSLLDGFGGAGWHLAGLTEPGPWCWLTAVAFAPAIVALAVFVARSWHRCAARPASRGGDQ
jgi:hypothetical protein